MQYDASAMQTTIRCAKLHELIAAERDGDSHFNIQEQMTAATTSSAMQLKMKLAQLREQRAANVVVEQ